MSVPYFHDNNACVTNFYYVYKAQKQRQESGTYNHQNENTKLNLNIKWLYRMQLTQVLNPLT
jgi:hypothetical protein